VKAAKNYQYFIEYKDLCRFCLCICKAMNQNIVSDRPVRMLSKPMQQLQIQAVKWRAES